MNVNIVPTCAWAVIEMARDPELLRAIRTEAETAYTTDARTGQRVLDLRRVVALPVLQSFYTEILRMHVSINISRTLTQPVAVAGYTLPTGSIVQAPTWIAHYADAVWAVDGHPASEFWAWRHVTYVDDKESGKPIPRFEMRGCPTDFFPFGERSRPLHLVFTQRRDFYGETLLTNSHP